MTRSNVVHQVQGRQILSRRVTVAIALTDAVLGHARQVAAACRRLGFEDDSILDGIGVMTGSAERESLPRLRAVPGVLAVETRCVIRAGRH
jgi:hypothetical protein